MEDMKNGAWVSSLTYKSFVDSDMLSPRPLFVNDGTAHVQSSDRQEEINAKKVLSFQFLGKNVPLKKRAQEDYRKWE